MVVDVSASPSHLIVLFLIWLKLRWHGTRRRGLRLVFLDLTPVECKVDWICCFGVDPTRASAA